MGYFDQFDMKPESIYFRLRIMGADRLKPDGICTKSEQLIWCIYIYSTNNQIFNNNGMYLVSQKILKQIIPDEIFIYNIRYPAV
jgi:hypothetical protein